MNPRNPIVLSCAIYSMAAGATVVVAAAPADGRLSSETDYSLSLEIGDALPAAANRSPAFQGMAGDSSGEAEEGLVLSGPYFLRSADPEPPGELELKFIYGYADESAGGHEHEFEFVLEWGMAENIEFILEAAVELGEGKVEGNGDIDELGFHIRFWEEDDWMPAFAMRHLIRVPTGHKSDGVDYIGRGLLTKTLVPNTLRLHFNPFLKTVDGSLDDNTRRFQWGAAVGVDYRVSDDLLLIADYQNFSSEEEGVRNQHILEFGADWTIGPHQTMGLQAEFGIDGDGVGTDFGAKISYILELALPQIDAQ